MLNKPRGSAASSYSADDAFKEWKEWDDADRTPMVANPQLLELVRRTARNTPAPDVVDPSSLGTPSEIGKGSSSAPIIAAAPPANDVDLAIAIAAPVLPATTTSSTVSAVTAPRGLVAVLAAAGALVIAGLAISFGAPAHGASGSSQSQLHADADAVAAVIEAVARDAHMRAEATASAPIMRAGIETDAATLEDLATSHALVTLDRGEVLAVSQLRDGKATLLLRAPRAAPPLPSAPAGEVRLVVSGSHVQVVASAAIANQSGVVEGMLAVALPCDLSTVSRAMGDRVVQATLEGGTEPIALVAAPRGSASADQVVAATVAVDRDLKMPALTLSEVASTTKPSSLRSLRYVCWALSAILLVGYVLARRLRLRPAIA